MMTLLINGEPCTLPDGETVAQLLVAQGLGDKRVAVERNGAIVPRAHHADTRLADGDRIEIVVAVGGG